VSASIQIPVAMAEEIIAAHVAPLRAEVARRADEVREQCDSGCPSRP